MREFQSFRRIRRLKFGFINYGGLMGVLCIGIGDFNRVFFESKFFYFVLMLRGRRKSCFGVKQNWERGKKLMFERG